MPGPHDRPVTRILRLPREQRVEREEELLGLVYDDLRALAGGVFRREGPQHTLQPTALVHEAWMRLGAAELEVEGREHFLAIAARAMRRVLVDHARRRAALRRAGSGLRVTLAPELEAQPATDQAELEVLALDQALTRLGERFPTTLTLCY